MGEYAIRQHDHQEVKIGTCESMYYLRYEDRHKVNPLSGNVNPGRDSNLFWRLPLPDEDDVWPGSYTSHDSGYLLSRIPEENNPQKYPEFFTDPETMDSPGNIQLHSNGAGVHVNMKCYHGMKLPEGTEEIQPFWNGKAPAFELAFVKNTKDGVLPVVRCKHCGNMWRYTWEEILPWISDKELRARLEKHVRTKEQEKGG